VFGKRLVYLDNTATTRTRREVVSEMAKYFKSIYANPSSIHKDGLIARGSIEMARERIAQTLNCLSDEIIFTGSGTESNNLAIRGTAMSQAGKGKHIITSQIEHSSILKTCQQLETQGYEVTYLDVDHCGRFDLDRLSRSIRTDTILVSLGYVNNEIGTVQDVNKIIGIVRKHNIILHFDAVQALPYIHLDLSLLGADLVSFSGHKLYAPKGIGLLYVRQGTNLIPAVTGGEQEFGIRSGTENVPYIVGLSKAILLNHKEKDSYVKGLSHMRNLLIEGVLNSIPDCVLTGDPVNRSPNHASFCFRGLNGKMLVKELSLHGFEVSSGSACSSPRNDPSHVLQACKIDQEFLHGSLRVTLGKYNRKRDVERFLKTLADVVSRMRSDKNPYNNESIFMSQTEFREKMEKGESMQILDVRHVNYPRRSIPGSIHIPVWKVKNNLRRLDPTLETIVVCYQGDIISPQVHQTLVKHGFKKVKVLKGGLFNYFRFIV